MPDFGAQPPEVNSARMYAGPGAGPMLAAAGGWRALAGELAAAASAYQGVIAGLTGQGWLGPASESMAAAATPYAEWLAGTASAVEHTANRMTLAVNDFEQAFAATVPPPVIAANRSRLAALVASDVFGQNATAIAATEAEYGQMWLQDAAAMYGYAARAATATSLTPFSAPPPVVDHAGSAGQNAAVAQATAGGGHDHLSQLLSGIPRALQGLSGGGAQASPAAAAAPLQSTDPLSQGASYIETLTRSVLPANDTNISLLYGMAQYSRNLNTDLDISQATGGRAGFGSGAKALSAADSTAAAGTRPVIAASSGSADAIGRLAVPPAWTESVPEVVPTAAAGPTAAADGAPAGHGAGMAAAGAAAARPGRLRRRGDRVEAHSERIAGRLTGTDEVHHWHAEPGGLKSLLGEVAGQPGVHEVYFDTDEPPQRDRG